MDSTNIQRGLNPPLNEVSFNEEKRIADAVYSSVLEKDIPWILEAWENQHANDSLAAPSNLSKKNSQQIDGIFELIDMPYMQ